jgi:uncharacterized damage-inducible protein DinB
MTETERIRDLLDGVYRGPSWYGPTMLQNLEGIDSTYALQQPIPNAHSIWEIVRHVTAWINEVIMVLDGEQYAVLPADQDWSEISVYDEAAWQSALAILESMHRALYDAVGEFPGERLEELVPGQDFTYSYMLFGLVEHNVYHNGQLGILRKA